MKIENTLENITTGDIVVDKESSQEFLMILYTNGYWSAYNLEQNCISHEEMDFKYVKENFKFICKNENCKITLGAE